MDYKLGARGIRSIVDDVMIYTMFELPSKKVKKYEVTAQYAQQQLDKAKLNKLETAWNTYERCTHSTSMVWVRR